MKYMVIGTECANEWNFIYLNFKFKFLSFSRERSVKQYEMCDSASYLPDLKPKIEY